MADLFYLVDGGNTIPFVDVNLNSEIGQRDYVQPANHQKTRQHTIEWHYDSSASKWTPNYCQDFGSDYIRIPNEGVAFTHLLGKGWVINEIAVHSKRLGNAKLAFNFYQWNETSSVYEPTPIIDPTTGQQLVVDMSDTDGPEFYLGRYIPTGFQAPGQNLTVATASTLAVLQSTINVNDTSGSVGPGNLNLSGGTLAVNGLKEYAGATTILANTAYIGFTVATVGEDELPEFMDGCLSVFVTLTDYVSEHDCACMAPPCPTEFPDPIC